VQSPLSKGVILADEVGLGKTIEAGIVLCQFWAERKRRLLVICPASLRKQWAMELQEKFNLPTRVLDAKAWREAQRSGRAPLNEKVVLILSMNYANALREDLKSIAWDLVVIDEAHKLRTRLETLRDEKVQDDAEFTEALIEAKELEDDLLDENLAEPDQAEAATVPRTIDRPWANLAIGRPEAGGCDLAFARRTE